MILTSPFHPRTSVLNETGLWSHWSGHLASQRYGLSDKFEYFAVRNSAGIFDSSPAVQVPHPWPGRRGVPGRRAGPRHPDVRPGQRPVHGVAGRPRLRRRGRGHPPPGPGRVPAHVRGTEPGLLPGPDQPAPRREDRGGERRSRHTRHPGPALARTRLPAHPGRRHDPLLRAGPRQDRRLSGDGVADGLQRRPRLRAVDRQYRRPQGLGRGLGVGRGLRRPAVRPRRAVHAPHRRRPAPARCRLLVQPVRLDRRGPLDADRARLRLDVQGPRLGRPGVHRAPGTGARDWPTRRRAGG